MISSWVWDITFVTESIGLDYMFNANILRHSFEENYSLPSNGKTSKTSFHNLSTATIVSHAFFVVPNTHDNNIAPETIPSAWRVQMSGSLAWSSAHFETVYNWTILHSSFQLLSFSSKACSVVSCRLIGKSSVPSSIASFVGWLGWGSDHGTLQPPSGLEFASSANSLRLQPTDGQGPKPCARRMP